MRIATPETQLKGSSGLRDTATATIKANAHAFRMLSSGLYSNKIAAVHREIGCNAADAHIEANTPDLPIEVKLPTKLNEQFYIKDWGPGLSHQQMVGTPSKPGLYLNYFDSTKQDSNTQTGAFGLGCKSPFSYTDSFVVTCAHAGKKRIYSVYVGEAGLPTISLMSEAPTDADWPHGVSVGFPVAPSDIWAFAQEAQKVFQWFKIPPRILGGQPVKPVEYSFETKDFAVSKTCIELTVVMGNVHYTVDSSSIGLERYGKGAAEQLVNSCWLVIKAGIGDVQVTPSRETLQFDYATKAFLKKAIINAGKVLSAEFNKRTQALLTGGWKNACALKGQISDLFHTNYNLDTILSHYGYKTKYEDIYRSGHAKVLRADYWKAGGRVSTLQTARRSGRESVSTRQFCESIQNGKEDRIELEPNTVIVFDEPLRFAERLRLAILDKVYDQIIWMKDQAYAQNLSKELYDCPVLSCSTLPLPVKKPRQKGVKKAILPVEEIRMSDGVTYQVAVVPDNMKYFLIDESYSTWGSLHSYRQVLGSQTTEYNWRKIWEYFEKFGDQIKCPIDGFALIKKRVVPRFEKAGWKEITTAMQTWLKTPEVQKHVNDLAKAWSPVVNGSQGLISSFCEIKTKHSNSYTEIEGLLTTHKIKDPIEKVYKASGDPNNLKIPKLISEFNAIAEQLNVDRIAIKGVSIDQMDQAIITAKPGLALVEWVNVAKRHPAHFKSLLSAHLGVS